MRTQALVTDLDGTLLPRGGVLADVSSEAFRRAGERGCVRIIATGRNLYAALRVLPEDYPIDYLIFSSGAGVMRWCDKKMLSAVHLREEDARKIAGNLWDFNVNFTVQRAIPDNHLFYYTSFYPEHEDFRRRVDTYSPFGERIDSPEEVCGEVTQFVIILDGRQLGLIGRLQKELHGYSLVRSTSPADGRAVWLEVFARGVNKGEACRALLGELGIPLSACAGLGNDYNDVDFLEICGQAFVVGNAAWQLKRRYKVVADDAEGGFAEFVATVLS